MNYLIWGVIALVLSKIVKGAVAFVEQLRRYVRYRLHGSGNVYFHGMLFVHSAEPVSYTQLDVYKRQVFNVYKLHIKLVFKYFFFAD